MLSPSGGLRPLTQLKAPFSREKCYRPSLIVSMSFASSWASDRCRFAVRRIIIRCLRACSIVVIFAFPRNLSAVLAQHSGSFRAVLCQELRPIGFTQRVMCALVAPLA